MDLLRGCVSLSKDPTGVTGSWSGTAFERKTKQNTHEHWLWASADIKQKYQKNAEKGDFHSIL